MTSQVLLVDFENLPKVDLTLIPDGVLVPFFFGASQRSVSKDFLKAALKLGDRFLPIDIEGQGKNALDFHIAFYLGEYLSREPAAQCAILSRDKGFDPLVRHLVGRKFQVRRAISLAEAFPGTPPPPTSPRPASRPPAVRERAVARAPTAAKSASAPRGAALDEAWATDLIRRLNKRNRPRRRKGLVALLMSRCGNKLTGAEAEGLVDQVLSGGLISETNGALSYPEIAPI